MEQQENMPSWVYLGLWGINSRKWAVAFLILAVLASIIISYIAIIVADYFLLSILLTPIWYGLAIRWVDKHGQWPS